MTRSFSAPILGAAAWIASTVAASAQSHSYCYSSRCTPTNVPEIDVSSGLLAVAAVAAALVLVWELRRRRAA